MTKTEEIALFRKFCAKLPADSYLATILAGVPEEIERMIHNDWAFSLAGRLDDLLKERRELEEEIKQLRQQVAELTQQVSTLKRELMLARIAKSEVAHKLTDVLQLLRAS